MKRIAPVVVRILFGSLFLISGSGKILDPIRFLFTIRDFRLAPGTIEPLIALFLPWFEAILGLFLVLGIFARTCALMLGGLNFLFIIAIASVMARGIVIDCGCFGLLADIIPLPDMADHRAIIRNLVFIGISAYLYRYSSSTGTLQGFLDARSGGEKT